MGHELTHGFDDQGSQYDMYGNLRPWWPKKIYKAFNAKTQCLARQYSNYSLDGRHVNGRLTLGENIADHGGMKMSYNAYKTWKKAHPEEVRLPGLKDISEDQLFFLSFAQLWCAKETKQVEQALLYSDPHSPGKYRVMGTLSTSQAFVDAWQCKAGSPMNRANKCVVWWAETSLYVCLLVFFLQDGITDLLFSIHFSLHVTTIFPWIYAGLDLPCCLIYLVILPGRQFYWIQWVTYHTFPFCLTRPLKVLAVRLGVCVLKFVRVRACVTRYVCVAMHTRMKAKAMVNW